MDVGELVLDRLVGADRAAELAALLGVFDRHVQHCLAGSDQLRGGGQRAELVSPRDVGTVRVVGCGDVEQSAARVDGLVLLTRCCVADLAVARQQDQPGRVGVEGPADLWRQCDGGDQLAGGQRRAAIVVGKQNRHHRDGFGDGSRHAPAAQAFAGHHQIDRVGTDPVEFLRHHQSGDAEVSQPRPDLAARCGVAIGPGAHGARDVGGGQRRVDAGREVALLRVQVESHLAFSRGSPSSRSAMMLR